MSDESIEANMVNGKASLAATRGLPPERLSPGSTGNERSAGQRSPLRHGGTPARPCICGHRSWAKSEWN